MSDEIRRITIRLPERVAKGVDLWAKKEQRSQNQAIVLLIERSLNKE